VEALRWFCDVANYEDTIDRVAVLRGNPVWSQGLEKAGQAITEIEASGWKP